MTPQSPLITLLETFGKYRLSPWRQAGRQGTGSGVCIGMCLDWLRRIYTPRKVEKSKFGSPGRSAMYNESEDSWWARQSVTESKHSKRFTKQVKIHKSYQDVTRLNLENMFDDVIRADLERRLLEEMQVEFGRSSTDLPSLDKVDDVFKGTELERVRAWQQKRADELSFRLSIEKRPELIVHAHSTFQTQWAISRYKKKSEKDFDHITLNQGKSQKVIVEQDAIPGNFLWGTYVVGSLFDLGVGESGILSCGKLAGSAHDLAFHFTGTDYYFFDPNFGEYCFPADSYHDLKDFFVGLWDLVYGQRGYDWAYWATYSYKMLDSD